jgi:hypothetical protein
MLIAVVGSIAPSGRIRESLRFSGYFTLLLPALGAVPAIVSGLVPFEMHLAQVAEGTTPGMCNICSANSAVAGLLSPRRLLGLVNCRPS